MYNKENDYLDNKLIELIKLLKDILADKWSIYYQYWIASMVINGPMKEEIGKVLKNQAKEEIEHAELIVERIFKIGGIPLISLDNPNNINDKEYDSNINNEVVLREILNTEQHIISHFHIILEKIILCEDIYTYRIIRKILRDELEHEEVINKFLNDLVIENN